MRVYF